jgi:hypothetical protein
MESRIKNYFAALFLTVGFTGSALGQSATEELTASINILSSVTVSSVQPLTVGTVVRSTTKEIDFNDGAVSTTESGGNSAIIGGEQRGIFKVSATTGAKLSFRLEVPQKLENGSNKLDIDYSNFKDFALDESSAESRAVQFNKDGSGGELFIGYAFERTPSSLEQFAPAGGFGNMDGDGFGNIDLTSKVKAENLTMNGPDLYIFYGAKVTASADQAIGDYEGDVTLIATVRD